MVCFLQSLKMLTLHFANLADSNQSIQIIRLSLLSHLSVTSHACHALLWVLICLLLVSSQELKLKVHLVAVTPCGNTHNLFLYFISSERTG